MGGGVEKLNTARGVAECCIEPNPSAAYSTKTNLLYVGWELSGFCINARAFSNRFQVDFAGREKVSWT